MMSRNNMRPQVFSQGEVTIKLIGCSKQNIIHRLNELQIHYCQFCYWLFIPDWDLMVSFEMTSQGITCCQTQRLDLTH